MLTELSASIVAEPRFRLEVSVLMKESLSRQVIPGHTSRHPEESVLLRLLECALSLAGSHDPAHKRLAYRISTSLLNTPLVRFDNLRDVVSLTLSRLGNFPADMFLAKQFGDPAYGQVPVAIHSERGLHRERNTVTLPDQRNLVLTDFQVQAWLAADREIAVAITAPTSAGKSFAMQQFLCAQVVRYPSRHHVVIVPTRALIGQVAAGLNEILALYPAEGTQRVVSTVPMSPEELGADQVVYVLTQERLQILLERVDPASFGMLAVDEAQLVSHGSRGIILQTVLERLWAGGLGKLVFGAPSAADVGVYQEMLQMDRLLSLRTTEPAVAQNLILLNVDASGDSVTCSALIEDEHIDLGRVPSPVRLLDERQLFAVLSFLFGRAGSSLVYAGGQAECEKIALLIRDCVLQFEPTRAIVAQAQAEVDDFVKLLKTHIHAEYPLIPAVEAGIGFHYGNMPAIVRIGVEQLFASGILRFLVCTSTLLHGVNFPAKNLFMYKPTRGTDTPLTAEEFWNLAGRAGRLGREFEGNVFLINRATWAADPVVQPGVTRADWPVLKTLQADPQRVLEVVSGRSIRTEADVETAAVKLYSEYQRERLARVRDRIIRYLVGKIRAGDVDGIIPLHPSQAGQAVYTSLLRLFKRIHNTFEGLPSQDNSHKFFAVIARDWMRGHPLARLIAERLRRSGARATAPPAIRSVLETVEQDLRFRYVKYTRCYNDILALALSEEGLEVHIPRIPAIPLYLELGACSSTMVSLIGMGLSRTTAALLADQSINKAMNRPDCLRWLTTNRAVRLSLPLVCRRELETIVP